MESQASSTSDLITLAQKGDRGSLGRLLVRYRNRLLRLASRQLLPPLRVRVSPSDIVQQSCLDALASFPDFRGKSEPDLLGWVEAILGRNVTDAIRRHLGSKKRTVDAEVSLRSREVRTSLVAKQPSPSHHLRCQEVAVLLLKAVEQLPEDQRLAVRLRYLEDCPLSEVARRLRRTPDAAGSLLRRALQKLGSILPAQSGACR